MSRICSILVTRKQSQEAGKVAHVAKEGNAGEVEARPTSALLARRVHARLTLQLSDWKKWTFPQFSILFY